MIVAIDTTTAPPGDVAPATLDLIATLAQPASPARQLVLLGREEHRRSLRHATHGLSTVLTLEAPEMGRQQVDDYRRRKLALLADHRVQLLHVAGGGPLDLLGVGLPVVLSVDRLGHRTSPGALTAAERWHRETWWTASAFRADAVVVPDDAVGDQLHEQLGLDTAKMFTSIPWQPMPGLTAAYARATRSQPLRKAA